MSKSATEIVSLYEMLRSHHGQKHQEMSEIARTYKDNILVPLPELDESERPAVANLLRTGIDQLSMRVASVMPMVVAKPLRPGIKISEFRAEQRRLAVDGWRTMNHMRTKQRRRARYLVAYGTSPITVSPVAETDDKRRIPFVRVRNPLCTYTAPMHDPDNVEPDYAIFVDRRSKAWLAENYPGAMSRLRKGALQTFDILEYVDCDETTLVVVGSPEEKSDRWGQQSATFDGASPYVVLDSVPNRTGICPVVMPGRIDLDGVAGQFNGMIGMYQQSAKLSALLMIQTVRDVFPNEWVESIPNSPSKPNIRIDADGLSGTIGIVENGRIMRLQSTQNQAAQLALDQLERAQRITGDIPAEWSGESGSNIRTARRGADVLSSAVDMPIQEYQEIFELSDEAMIRRMVAVQKTYWGSRPSMYLIPANGKISREDYTPNDAFETDQVCTRYPMPGTDAAQMTVAFGQKIGMGVLSAQTAMELDPSVEDPTQEQNRIVMEGLRRALLTGMEQQASGGQLDPHTIAQIALALNDGRTTLEAAVDEVHKQMQKDQAAAAQPAQAPEQGAPEQGPAPEQMPGLAPAAAAQTSGIAGASTVPPPSAGASNLIDMLKAAHPPASLAASA